MTKVFDLSKTEGTYTKEIEIHLPEIYSAYEDRTISIAAFKDLVINIVNKARDTKARKNFLSNLTKKTSKDQILFYTNNAYMRGCGLGTDINDKFNM